MSRLVADKSINLTIKIIKNSHRMWFDSAWGGIRTLTKNPAKITHENEKKITHENEFVVFYLHWNGFLDKYLWSLESLLRRVCLQFLFHVINERKIPNHYVQQ